MSLFGSSQPEPPPQPPRADDGGLREEVPAAARQEAVKRPKWRWVRLIFNGHRPEPLPSHQGTVEEAEPGKLGVCCSGGGIRSAAFSLGALQALQERGELRKASYLAAVSGGSYIAAAISMVAKTGKGNSDRSLISRQPAFAQGSPEEQYLRNRCSYLAPTMADKTYLGLRIFLGLLVNLAFISLPLVGLALILTGWLYAPELGQLTGSLPQGGDYQANLPACFWKLPLAILFLSFIFGACTLLFRWRKETWERFFATWATRLLFVAVLFAVLLVVVPYLVDWLRDVGDASKTAGSVAEANAKTFGATALALLAGVVAQLGHFIRSKPAEEGLDRAKKAASKLGRGARLGLAYAAGALIGPALLLLIFALTVAIGMTETARESGANGELVVIGAAVLVLFGVLYAFVDLTTWSLHPYYKRRLSSAFALKRIKVDALDAEERNRVEAVEPSPQGIAVERDYDDLVPISKTALENEKEDGAWPTLLVCAAANISDSAATPPGRAVTSFTFSANTVGGPLVGAINTARLEHAFDGKRDPDASTSKQLIKLAKDTVTGRKHRRRDLSLPAAVAMSGAAISPSMGKMTARPLRFLMALTNVRLGVWVPNPRWVAAKDGKSVPSRPRPSYLVRELFGLNGVAAKYLYVTDGGHYENLGLVELLRRGCTDVYCLDASGVGGDGAEFKTLGDAIALARSELNVEIEFSDKAGEDPEELSPEKDEEGKVKAPAKRDVVTATIRYPRRPNGEPGATGTLVYVRNTMTDKAPWDVRAYHESDPRFPNNPTVDQLYTDQKFEAYRVLGVKAGANAYERLRPS
jgi:Patatin-like phospholipase